MTTSAPPTDPTECPACHARTPDGRFCAKCGTPLGTPRCASCDTELTPSAKFCHRCGLPAGAPAPATEKATFASSLPWAVAGIAMLALIAMIAGSQFSKSSSALPAGDPSVAADPTISAQVNGGASAPFANNPALASCVSGPVPDISKMTPHEQADSLFDLVMRFNEQGRPDCAGVFAPMAEQVYARLGGMTLDDHYDVGRIALVTGDTATAVAEADTILGKHPTHLLGLILSAQTAHLKGNAAAEKAAYSKFLAAEPKEKAAGLPEYTAHANDISLAETAARGGK